MNGDERSLWELTRLFMLLGTWAKNVPPHARLPPRSYGFKPPQPAAQVPTRPRQGLLPQACGLRRT